MKQILYNKNLNNYISDTIIGKYIYYKEERKDSYLYFILIVNSIDFDNSTNIITYNTDKCYLLYVPKDRERKAYVYDNYKKVNVLTKFDLYEMNFSEFVNTFREFIRCDGKSVSELPDKIIQDMVY